MNLVITSVVALLAGTAILKRYNAIAVLFLAGMVLFSATILVTGNPILGAEQTTGSVWLDIFEAMHGMFNNRLGGMGFMLFALLAYAKYMSYIGANDILINVSLRILSGFNKPYLLLAVTFVIGSLISLAGFGATSLAVLLMSTLYPVLTRLGLSPISVAAAMATTCTISFSPLAVDSVIAAQNIGMSVEIYTLKYQIPIAIPSMIAIAIAHMFWQKRCDIKQGLYQHSDEGLNTDMSNISVRTAEVEGKAPAFYGFLPLLPIMVLILTSNDLGLVKGLEISIGGIALVCMFMAMLFEAIRHRSGKKAMEGIDPILQGMQEALPVVVILVAAGIFASGMKSIGAIDAMIASAGSMGFGPTAMMFAFVALTGMVALLTGSGNAPFYAFVELIPRVAESMGINGIYMLLPMQQASNACRAMSPVAGVIVATAGMAKVSPFELVRRTAIPTAIGLLVNILLSILFLPV